MKKHFRLAKTLMRIIGYYIVCLFMTLMSLVRGMLSGGMLVKITEIFIVIAGVFLYKSNKTTFWIILMAFMLIEFAFSIYAAVIPDDNREKRQSNACDESVVDWAYFKGMSAEEAKKEYRRLMKKYHPDNVEGDTQATQMISNAYREYCLGRRV